MSEQGSVVLTDLHGHADKLREAVAWYGDDTHFVINGDVLDRGPDSCETLNIIKDLDADLVLGNHEWAMLGAFNEQDSERRWAWLQLWLGKGGKVSGYEGNTLKSYGERQRSNELETAHYFKERLQKLGHLALLQKSELYYEDDELLVVHAGLSTRLTWARQQSKLDEASALAKGRIYIDEPPQLISYEYAMDWERPSDVQQTLITGHHHGRSKQTATRRFPEYGGKPTRVQLASSLIAGDPLFAYESWTGKITRF
ncbi:metallophosphoesterase [Candidatus Saccharibacteria bacterium]|nr:metallophosphoesterase [Candidatus Saccharibacteria bacterium]